MLTELPPLKVYLFPLNCHVLQYKSNRSIMEHCYLFRVVNCVKTALPPFCGRGGGGGVGEGEGGGEGGGGG